MSERYSIADARYTKKSIAVHCQPDGGFMTREMRVTEAVGGRWSNREKAYILPASKGPRLRQLIADGYDGTLEFAGSAYKTRMVLTGPTGNDPQANPVSERNDKL